MAPARPRKEEIDHQRRAGFGVVAQGLVLAVEVEAPEGVDRETAEQHDDQHGHAAPRLRRRWRRGLRQSLDLRAALQAEAHAGTHDSRELNGMTVGEWLCTTALTLARAL